MQVSLAFLSTLLDEAYAYLHGALCAGVLGRKLFTMPFHRDIELTPARVLRMRAALAHCMQVSDSRAHKLAMLRTSPAISDYKLHCVSCLHPAIDRMPEYMYVVCLVAALPETLCRAGH